MHNLFLGALAVWIMGQQAPRPYTPLTGVFFRHATKLGYAVLVGAAVWELLS